MTILTVSIFTVTVKKIDLNFYETFYNMIECFKLLPVKNIYQQKPYLNILSEQKKLLVLYAERQLPSIIKKYILRNTQSNYCLVDLNFKRVFSIFFKFL